MRRKTNFFRPGKEFHLPAYTTFCAKQYGYALIAAIALIVHLSALVPLQADTGATQRNKLKELTIERLQALADRNTKEIDKLCSDDFRFINHHGRSYDRDSFINMIKRAKPRQLVYNIKSYQLFFANDVQMAFAVSQIEEKAIRSDKISESTDFIITEIFVKKGFGWKSNLVHASEIE
ncbi:MAG: DUF4440 domain-containing protein [Chitinivibrionales bacterium]|nr:DUF4440 domain-containing protein [Chitinivibrionales bacterium]